MTKSIMSITSTKSRPILFAAPMVRAILDGRKTQTRRVVTPTHRTAACPWGTAGDRLWVRERWGYATQFHDRRASDGGPILYAADEDPARRGPWRASCHMPREACRLVLEITAVRMERLCEITRADALLEGFPKIDTTHTDPLAWFQQLWDGLHAERGIGWGENPLVWVIGFHAHVLTPTHP